MAAIFSETPEVETPIAGVVLAALKRVDNERGHLMEVSRTHDTRALEFAQVYVTATKPGVVKAWYRHRQQQDQLVIVKGAISLVLYDARPDSPSFQAFHVISMDERAPLRVKIPPGIWHGFRAFGDQDAYLMHLNDTAFDFDHPDEERLPIDSDLVPFCWTTGEAG